MIAAAYLHDAGMVCSEGEKDRILQQEDWKTWITESEQAAQRWRLIEKLRVDPERRYFLADVQRRYLIAEYIRRFHHERAADVIQQHQLALGRFEFDDDMLGRTISDFCVAHGLPSTALADQERFPLLRQIRNDDANVRLLAILLRLGDLLDITSRRACPLLLNAASPLPSDSLEHWMQYQRIKHLAFTPAKIELTAECETAEEHRVLRDWCQWIEDEVKNAPSLLAGSKRHRNWQPPVANLKGPNPTIKIRPSAKALYRPCDWRFELDDKAVFERLISDVYGDPLSFVRELIQNALDAMRCQAYEDLPSGNTKPADPTQLPEAVRNQYKLKIRIYQAEPEPSQQGERRLIIEFDDCGLGMDEEVVTHHFLQVGRSFYTTSDFRRRYSFNPTSRFGIGFLSVFNVSELVTIETFKASAPMAKALKLTLKGPRNYLTLETSDRTVSGTKIVIHLNPDVRVEPGGLTQLIGKLCRRVEFPIIIDDFGVSKQIHAEVPTDFIFDIPDARGVGARFFILKSFPIKGETLTGELYVLINKSAEGIEDWTQRFYYGSEYLKSHPGAAYRELPESVSCLHGIFLGEHFYRDINS
ncbi:MAG: hypothetical protein ABSG46_01530, partial [Candidatus Binataceae bacterium]